MSRDFRTVLDEHGLSHRKIKPRCPEENGTMERAHRTFREALDGEELTDLYQAWDVMNGSSIGTTASDCIQRWITCDRSLFYLGTAGALKEAHRQKMAEQGIDAASRTSSCGSRPCRLQLPGGVAN